MFGHRQRDFLHNEKSESIWHNHQKGGGERPYNRRVRIKKKNFFDDTGKTMKSK